MLQNELTPTVFYASLFVTLFIWMIIARKNAISKFIVGIWVFSTIAAIIFQMLMPFYSKIQYGPYIFLFVCFFVSLQPLSSCDKMVERFNFKQNNKIIKAVMWGFVIISIIPLFENLNQVLVSTTASNGSAIADMYNSKMYGGGFKVTWLSSLGMFFNSIDGVFIQFLFFVPFYLLTQTDVNRFLSVFMFLPLANHLLFQIAASGRGTAVLFIMNSIFFILLFRKSIPEKKLKIVKIVGLSLFILLLSVLSVITFARKDATNAEDDTSVFIGYYIAKSHLDFNEKLWHIPVYTEGDNTLAFFKDVVGLDTFKSFLKKEAYWGPQIGIPPGNFYTYIGDCFMDFGPTITLVLFFATALIANSYFKSKRKVTLMRLFMLFAYSQVIIMGWSINYFKPYDATRNLILSSVLLFVVYVL